MTEQENVEEYFRRLNWLDSVCDIYAKGKEIYTMLAETLKESSGVELIVSPANLGDTVFIATLSMAYKETHHINNLIICAKERQAEAVEWFEGVDGTVGLDDQQMMCLRYYFTISRNFYSNGIRYGHIPCYIDAAVPNSFMHIPPGFGGIPLISVWEKRILDLPDRSPTCEIVVPEEILQSRDMNKYNGAVLIAPAAFTNKGIPESFWEKIVVELKKRGVTVYCNSGGLYYDKLISGAIECVLSTKELILNAPLFRHVIAVRSGFTDLVSKTDARLTVLHLGGTEDGSLSIEYGTTGDDVRDLGRITGIFPYRYCAGREDELIQLILSNID